MEEVNNAEECSCALNNTLFNQPPCFCSGFEPYNNIEPLLWCTLMFVGAVVSLALSQRKRQDEDREVNGLIAEFAAIHAFREYEVKNREQELQIGPPTKPIAHITDLFGETSSSSSNRSQNLAQGFVARLQSQKNPSRIVRKISQVFQKARRSNEQNIMTTPRMVQLAHTMTALMQQNKDQDSLVRSVSSPPVVSSVKNPSATSGKMSIPSVENQQVPFPAIIEESSNELELPPPSNM